jgi:hypothetical protein
MKNLFITTLLILFAFNLCQSQAWMTSLDIAQKLASVQNKMVLMVWEESTMSPYPVLVNDNRGVTIIISNLFEDEELSPLIWEHFVPVIVSENQYADMYKSIKGKRKQFYIDKFNDDSIKIMDINGRILNSHNTHNDFQNITTLIKKYSINTEFLAQELRDYKSEKNFYSAYFLASKYLDLGLYANRNIRSEIVYVSNIYLEEALAMIKMSTKEDQQMLAQRCSLLKIQESLIIKRPQKVIRQLKKMDAEHIKNNNQSFVAFLYYTAYMCLGQSENAMLWKSNISLVNLRKAQMLINLNL